MHEFARMSLGVMGVTMEDIVAPDERPSKLEVMMHVAQAPPGKVTCIAPHPGCAHQNLRLYGDCCNQYFAKYGDGTMMTQLSYINPDFDVLEKQPECIWCTMPMLGHRPATL